MLRKLFNKTIPVSEGVKEFCKNMINNPQDWVQGQYEFTNMNHRDIAIWTCNGVSYIKICGFNALTMADKIMIANSIKITMAKKLLIKR